MSSETWLQSELRFSKSAYKPWGKYVIQALDSDSYWELKDIFEKYRSLGAHVDAQATAEGYGGYMWSPWMHNFLGDTALHLALRQKKILCAYVLLLMHSDITVQNAKGETVNDLSRSRFDQSILQMQKEAGQKLLPLVKPQNFKSLPDVRQYGTGILHRNIESEAWALMRQGRVMYHEEVARLTSDAGRADLEPEGTKAHSISDVITLVRRQRKLWERRHLELAAMRTHKQTREEKEKELERRRKENEIPWMKDKLAADTGNFHNNQASTVSRAHGKVRTDDTIEQSVDFPGQAEKTPDVDLRRLKSLGNLKFLNGKQRGNDWTKDITVKTGAERRISPSGRNVEKISAASQGNDSNSDNNHNGDGVETGGSSLDEVTKSAMQEELQYGILPVRFVTTLSTQSNMKYMKLGDEGLIQLSEALEGDPVISSLYLSSARITCVAALKLAQVITTMSALTSLDLSNNCIADDGAVAIAQAIERLSACRTPPQRGAVFPSENNDQNIDQAQQSRLENDAVRVSNNNSCPVGGINLRKINLAGNRITVIGAEKLITAALAQSSPSLFFSIRNNNVGKADIAKLQESITSTMRNESEPPDEDVSTSPNQTMQAQRINKSNDKSTAIRILL